jgi:hypothetical protein
MRGLLLAVTAAAAVAVAACGSDDDPVETTTATERVAGPTGPTGPSGQVDTDATDRAGAIAVVERFYRLLNSYRYREAWSLVPPEVRAESGGFTNWKDGYRSTLRSSPQNIAVDSSAAKRAVVSLKLRATDIDDCTGKHLTQVFTGSWTLTAVDGDWQPEAISFDKASGPTPATEASDCGGGSGGRPAPGPPGSCEAGYEPCVPTYPPDVDCADVGGSVTVTASDPHGLDADRDGVGCE